MFRCSCEHILRTRVTNSVCTHYTTISLFTYELDCSLKLILKEPGSTESFWRVTYAIPRVLTIVFVESKYSYIKITLVGTYWIWNYAKFRSNLINCLKFFFLHVTTFSKRSTRRSWRIKSSIVRTVVDSPATARVAWAGVSLNNRYCELITGGLALTLSDGRHSANGWSDTTNNDQFWEFLLNRIIDPCWN